VLASSNINDDTNYSKYNVGSPGPYKYDSLNSSNAKPTLGNSRLAALSNNKYLHRPQLSEPSETYNNSQGTTMKENSITPYGLSRGNKYMANNVVSAVRLPAGVQ